MHLRRSDLCHDVHTLRWWTTFPLLEIHGWVIQPTTLIHVDKNKTKIDQKSMISFVCSPLCLCLTISCMALLNWGCNNDLAHVPKEQRQHLQDYVHERVNRQGWLPHYILMRT